MSDSSVTAVPSSLSIGSSQTVAQSSSSVTSNGPSLSTTSQSVVASTPTPTPTTSSTPVPTDSSSTPPVAQTTPTTPASIANAASSTTTVPTSTLQSTISFTSQVETTLASTDASGSVVLITSTVPEVVTTTAPVSTGGSNGTSSTGVIVGAVVGGVLGIALVALLLFCIRKRRNDDFDGNFDPDRVVGHTDLRNGTLPNVDLADDVTPFPQSQSFVGQGGASMRQHGKSPYIPVPSSLGPSGYSADFYSPGAGTSAVDGQPRSPPPGAYASGANMYGTGPADWHNPRPGVSPPPSTVSNTTSSTRATKEREALGRSAQGTGLTLATQQEATAEGSGDVVVHQDAGRAPIEEHVPPREIPPAYESIRQD